MVRKSKGYNIFEDGSLPDISGELLDNDGLVCKDIDSIINTGVSDDISNKQIDMYNKTLDNSEKTYLNMIKADNQLKDSCDNNSASLTGNNFLSAYGKIYGFLEDSPINFSGNELREFMNKVPYMNTVYELFLNKIVGTFTVKNSKIEDTTKLRQYLKVIIDRIFLDGGCLLIKRTPEEIQEFKEINEKLYKANMDGSIEVKNTSLALLFSSVDKWLKEWDKRIQYFNRSEIAGLDKVDIIRFAYEPKYFDNEYQPLIMYYKTNLVYNFKTLEDPYNPLKRLLIKDYSLVYERGLDQSNYRGWYGFARPRMNKIFIEANILRVINYVIANTVPYANILNLKDASMNAMPINQINRNLRGGGKTSLKTLNTKSGNMEIVQTPQENMLRVENTSFDHLLKLKKEYEQSINRFFGIRNISDHKDSFCDDSMLEYIQENIISYYLDEIKYMLGIKDKISIIRPDGVSREKSITTQIYMQGIAGLNSMIPILDAGNLKIDSDSLSKSLESMLDFNILNTSKESKDIVSNKKIIKHEKDMSNKNKPAGGGSQTKGITKIAK